MYFVILYETDTYAKLLNAYQLSIYIYPVTKLFRPKMESFVITICIVIV